MPKQVLSKSVFHKTEYIRPNHDESGIVYVKKTYNNKTIYDKNKKIRESGDLKPGVRPNIRRDSETVYYFKVNPIQWAHFKRERPDLIKGLHSRDQITREKAAADIKSLHPHWVVIAPKTLQAV